MPALTSRPLGFRPSPPTIADLYFCIQAYQACCKACISSGDGWARLIVDSRKMNKYFAMIVLHTVSDTLAEACPRLVRIQRTSGNRSDTGADYFCKCAPRSPRPRFVFI